MPIEIKDSMLALIAGILTSMIFFFTLFPLGLFANGTLEFRAFIAMSFIYGLLGFTLRFFISGNSARIGIASALPMFGLLVLANFSDSVPSENVPRLIAPLSPFSACIGALLASRLWPFRVTR